MRRGVLQALELEKGFEEENDLGVQFKGEAVSRGKRSGKEVGERKNGGAVYCIGMGYGRERR